MGAFEALGSAVLYAGAVGAATKIGGNLASGRFFGGNQNSNAPPRLDRVPNGQKIRNDEYNASMASIIEGLEKEQFGIGRDVNNKMLLTYKNKSDNVNLNDLQSNGSSQRNLGLEKAASIIKLQNSIAELNATIEEMEIKAPNLIEKNKVLVSDFKKGRQEAFNRGFDIKERTINNKLAEMGLENSSSALGIAMSLANQRAIAHSNLSAEIHEFEEGLEEKQQNRDLKERAMQLNVASFKKDVADSKQQNYLNSRALERGVLSDANSHELARHSYSAQRNLSQEMAGQVFGKELLQDEKQKLIKDSTSKAAQQLGHVAKNAVGRGMNFFGKYKNEEAI